MARETGPRSSETPESAEDASQVTEGKVRTGVLRWQQEPIDVEKALGMSLSPVLKTLVGDLGCRVLIGLTEDLTSMVLRVYHEDRSLAMFPKSEEDWADIWGWANGPTVLDDVRRFGEVVAETPRRRRR